MPTRPEPKKSGSSPKQAVRDDNFMLSRPSERTANEQKRVFEKRIFEYLAKLMPGLETVKIEQDYPWVCARIKCFLTFTNGDQCTCSVDIKQSNELIWTFALVVPKEFYENAG